MPCRRSRWPTCRNSPETPDSNTRRTWGKEGSRHARCVFSHCATISIRGKPVVSDALLRREVGLLGPAHCRGRTTVRDAHGDHRVLVLVSAVSRLLHPLLSVPA